MSDDEMLFDPQEVDQQEWERQIRTVLDCIEAQSYSGGNTEEVTATSLSFRIPVAAIIIYTCERVVDEENIMTNLQKFLMGVRQINEEESNVTH